ncbi:MAG: hypothetical protein ACP6IQ_02520 [Candidatus Njordarchaeia archaeon]
MSELKKETIILEENESCIIFDPEGNVDVAYSEPVTQVGKINRYIAIGIGVIFRDYELSMELDKLIRKAHKKYRDYVVEKFQILYRDNGGFSNE